jgi:acetyl esterase/lipase
VITSLLFLSLLSAAEPIRLWDSEAPSSVGDADKNIPTITPYVPSKTKGNGTAIVVCPGGGYGGLALDHEGTQIAEWLNERGITAFVLKYRIAVKGRPGPLQPAPMLDVQRAIRLVRSKAKDYGIDANKIGVWGFSAGGHLASTATTHFDKGDPRAKDAVDRVSSRPDFSILSYPVISMGKETHGGSKRNLLGEKPDPKLVEFYSNHLQVTKETPPVFLFHTAEDKVVVIENSKLFVAACKEKGVDVEFVEYEKGQHGIGLGLKTKLPAAEWSKSLHQWLIKHGLASKSAE